MFKGFQRTLIGVEVDREMVEWVEGHLLSVEAYRTGPRGRLPVPTDPRRGHQCLGLYHVNEPDQVFYLDELKQSTVLGTRFC